MQRTIRQQAGGSNGHCYIKLPVFEGPFDLLFYLVNREELDIYEIPLAKITRQYLQYLQSLQEQQVEVAGEFLVMAASLLHLKSRLLLPQPPPFLDATVEEEMLLFGSKEALVQSLLEYKHFKMAASILQERINRQQRIYLRASAPQRYYSARGEQSKVDPAGLPNLKKAWYELIEKNKGAEQPPEIILFTTKTSLVRILRWIVTALRKNTFFNNYLDDFWDNFGLEGTKEEHVTVFTLFLELARRGRLSLKQANPFGRICILKPTAKGDGGTNRDAPIS